jgi:hypothetical protein
VQSIVDCSNFHKHSLYVGIWNSNSSVHMCIFIVTGYCTVVLSLPLSLAHLKHKGHLTTCHDGTEWEGTDITVPIPILGTKRGYVVNPTPQSFYPCEGSSTHCTRSWVDLRAALESTEDLASTRVHTIQPAASYCSECALPAAPLYNCHVYSYSHIA